MDIISESVLMLLTENYQNWSILVKATVSQSWRVFLRHSVVIITVARCTVLTVTSLSRFWLSGLQLLTFRHSVE